ncbi:MAG: hypothetical protein L6R39_003831 [Caloplaca ligustica]|nr:MAG: hypothetical protein L6R39_003831 [Caloplaca ligustica]
MASRFPPTAPQQTYYSDINGNLLPLSNNAWPPSDGPVDPYGYPYYSSDPFAAYAYPTSRPTAVLEERIRARRHAASHNDGWDERSVNGRVTRDVNIPHRVRSRSPIRGAPRNTSPDGAVSGDLSDDDFTFESTPSSDDDNIWIDANGVRFSVLGNMKARQSANRNRPEKPSPYQQTSYTIWRSRFAGDAYAEADHFAEIMTRFPPTAPQSGNQGLFEWIHLESRQPSLSSFLVNHSAIDSCLSLRTM